MTFNIVALKKHEYELQVELELVRKLIELRTAPPAKKRVVQPKKRKKTQRRMSPEKRAEFAKKIAAYHQKKREALNGSQEAPTG